MREWWYKACKCHNRLYWIRHGSRRIAFAAILVLHRTTLIAASMCTHGLWLTKDFKQDLSALLGPRKRHKRVLGHVASACLFPIKRYKYSFFFDWSVKRLLEKGTSMQPGSTREGIHLKILPCLHSLLVTVLTNGFCINFSNDHFVFAYLWNLSLRFAFALNFLLGPQEARSKYQWPILNFHIMMHGQFWSFDMAKDGSVLQYKSYIY